MKPGAIEITWSDEDLAYLAWSTAAPDLRALGETPQQAQLRLERLLASSGTSAAPHAPGGGNGGTGGEDAENAFLNGKCSSTSAQGDKPDKPDKPSPRSLRLTRLEAASKQLDAAIWLHWQGGDPLAVHALVTAAGEVFADRLARWHGQEAGDALPRQTYLRLLRCARELLRTPGGEDALEADIACNEALIAQAIADRLGACPSRALSPVMADYYAWYGATRGLPSAPLPDQAVPPRPAPTMRPSRRPSRRHAEAQCQFSLLPDPA